MVELQVEKNNRNQRIVGRMELFDPDRHGGGDERAGPNTSQNRDSRRDNRADR
jgi:hypothetical protein